MYQDTQNQNHRQAPIFFFLLHVFKNKYDFDMQTMNKEGIRNTESQTGLSWKGLLNDM